MRKTALAVALLVLSAGCAGLSELARGAFTSPKLTFRAASIDALDLEGATVAFRFDLENPNGIGLDLASLGWGFEVEGTRIAAGDFPGGLKIPARGTAPVAFPVRVRFSDVPGIVNLLGSGKDDLRYRLSGKVGVRTPLGLLDLPLSHEDVLRLPDLPRFAVEGLAVRSVSFDAVEVGVRLRVRNPNAFALPAGRVSYDLALGGARVASVAGAPIAAVAGGASAIVELPVRVNLLGAGRAAAGLARGGEVDVGLTGTAEVAGLPLPLDLRGRVPARR